MALIKKNYSLLAKAMPMLAILFISFSIFNLLDIEGTKYIILSFISLGLIVAAQVLMLLFSLGNQLNRKSIVLPVILLFSGLIFHCLFLSSYTINASRVYKPEFINDFRNIPTLAINISGLVFYILGKGNKKLQSFSYFIIVAIILLNLLSVFTGSPHALSMVITFSLVLIVQTNESVESEEKVIINE